MDSSDDTLTTGSVVSVDDKPFRLRSYQAEMVEESLHANIIVVMDTGSGKTHVAIERTRTELEMCKPDKIVWFLAPTVTLCEQQYEVFKKNLPGYGIQLLSGKDDVDHWSDQDIWDAVLLNVRIVLSTHQVLLDALTHAFVRMSGIALLIFDEAHHCTLKHPAHRIMSDFYKPFADTADHGEPIPKVLGLSASPVMKAAASTEALEQIERNLHATTKTPKIHRSDLMRFVHKPELVQVSFPSPMLSDLDTPLLLALERAYTSYDLRTDPYMVDLLQKQRNGYDVAKPLEKLFTSRKTYCNEELKILVRKAKDMADELGLSAMEWYLHQCITQFQRIVHVMSDYQLVDTSVHEKQHLLGILGSLPLSDDTLRSPRSVSKLSRKVEMLIDILLVESKNNAEFTGLIFVEQRAWVATLAQILTTHPRTRNLFRVGTFVGTSNSSKRKTSIANFAEPRNQQTTLDDFRAGRTNLILATSVLEEGIDISSCHLVICFERPKNLKSFVQRRGRARKQHSKYLIFIPQDEVVRSSESWRTLEAEMRRAYEDDLRLVQEADEREKEEEEEGEGHVFQVLGTEARLTLDDACQHLSHFCALSVTTPFVDSRPQYEFFENNTGQITSEVTLPISIDSSVRKARSLNCWRTEKMARKDAALEAYKALYFAGLINDNLLPKRQIMDTDFRSFDQIPSIIEVTPLFDPWSSIAQYQQGEPFTWYRTLLTVSAPAEDSIRIILLTPTPLPAGGSDIILYWNQAKTQYVRTSELPSITLDEQMIQTLRFITWKMLHSFFHGRMQENKDDLMWLVAPCDSHGRMLDDAALSVWKTMMQGRQSLSDLVQSGRFDTANCGLISIQGDSRKYTLNTEATNYLAQSEFPVVWADPVPKRRDFLHPIPMGPSQHVTKNKAEPLALSECMVDNLPGRYSLLALLFPPILHKLEMNLIADSLRTTLLRTVSFDPVDLPILLQAITTSSADGKENYQRLEFLGDCVLKFITSLHLMAANTKEPESFLTQKKGNIVSNGFLAHAAIAAGLDQYVVSKPFTAAKWKPRLHSDTVTNATILERAQLSSKIIADVIESMIGASFVVGGFSKVFTCIRTLLPQERWTPMSDANSILYELAQDGHAMTNLIMLENLVGYTFSKRTLACDAMTHASYLGPNVNCSYQRLEFLGDAVLDFIVTRKLYAHKPEISHQTMHAIRTAMVNASFLAFRMFETTVEEGLTNKATMQTEMNSRALWQFMRSSAFEVNAARDTALIQHNQAREQISKALEQNARFPWQLLALTDPPKFLSDIVESTLAAIYIDSRGDVAACERFVQRLGILTRLDRILRDGVDCLHPKERLGHLAVNRSVKYIIVKASEDVVVESKATHWCQVLVGGEKVGGTVGGLKRLNAETIAASLASQILETTNDVIMSGTEGEDDGRSFDAGNDGGVLLDN